MLDLAVQNTWLLHKKVQNGKVDHLAFRRRIVLAITALSRKLTSFIPNVIIVQFVLLLVEKNKFILGVCGKTKKIWTNYDSSK